MPRILVVDDEAYIRRLYEDILTREGYQVQSATDGEEALLVIKEVDFDILVLDIELGGTSGLDVLKQIRGLRPDLPVILNSAYTTYMSDFSTWMADAYVVKSSDIKPLLDKIEELLSKCPTN